MTKVYAIAVNTFREAIRDKIFYSLVFFALMILGASVVLSTLTLGEQSRIIEDLSLSGINIFGVIISIFVGIGLVNKELEKKTIYTLISKPIKRYQFLCGKYLGLALTLLVYISSMSAVFLLVLYGYGREWGGDLLVAVLLIYFELLVVTAAALLFSTFTTPTLAATYTLALYVIGHLTSDLKGFTAKGAPDSLKKVMEAAYYILPNLENFNVKGLVVHKLPIPVEYVAMSMLYGLLYVVWLMAIAVLVFQKRNFK